MPTVGPWNHVTVRRSRPQGLSPAQSKNNECHDTGSEQSNRQGLNLSFDLNNVSFDLNHVSFDLSHVSLDLNRSFDLKIVTKLMIHMPKRTRSRS